MSCPYNCDTVGPFGRSNSMLKEGDPAPPFQLPADDGREISLKDLRGKHVALYFYPKASTPGCTTEAIEFRELKNEFDKLNTIILRWSTDLVSWQAKSKAKHTFI